MDGTEYQKYLQSEHWQGVKARMRASKYLRLCYVCGSAGPLDLHHKSYKRLGSERLNDLIWLCRRCLRRLPFLRQRAREADSVVCRQEVAPCPAYKARAQGMAHRAQAPAPKEPLDNP